MLWRCLLLCEMYVGISVRISVGIDVEFGLGMCLEWRRGFLWKCMCSVRMFCWSFCGHSLWEYVVGIVRVFLLELSFFNLIV